jgi:hypothetical protein
MESKSLTYSSFSSSSPPSISLSFYFSLSFSLFTFLCRARKKPFFSRLSFSLRHFSSARERPFLFFSFCRTWVGPIMGPTPTISPSSPRREAHRSSSHHLESMPTSRRQISSLSVETIFVSMSDGFLSVWIFFSFIC